jgi:beta-lactamase class A
MDGTGRPAKASGGDLPSGVRVAHKSGTSDVHKELAHATNDTGLIPIPDGRRIAIAVFVTDSTADRATRQQVIARIARAAYDASLKSTGSSRQPTSSSRVTHALKQATFLLHFATIRTSGS